MAEGTAVTAPMVGKVVEVPVKVGDSVKFNQPVVVIEAMKMKVDIVAPVDGTVTEIKVSPGDTVDTGAVVAVIS